MRKEYIPVVTDKTIFHKPQTQEELDNLIKTINIGDMVFNPFVFDGMWYTLGLLDKDDPNTRCLFPNIIMGEHLSQLTKWGMARYNYLKENNTFLVSQLGVIELYKHCLEIEERAKERKQKMMFAVRNDPSNKVTERDKALDPIAWARRMNNFKHAIHESIYVDLIFS